MIPPLPLDELSANLGATWPAIGKAQADSAEVANRLRGILQSHDSAETSIVAYGSLARGEWTKGSDLDWTLLVDGGVDPEHWTSVQRVTDTLEKAGFRKPSGTGSFASLSSSHDLVHKIGGQEDTNANTTRRLLLLLESLPLGKDAARHRTRRQIIFRYLEDDRGIRHGSGPLVPRFLLNDFARYWRTMAVDFAFK